MKNNHNYLNKRNTQIKFDFFKHKALKAALRAEDRNYESMSLYYAMLVGLIEGKG